MSENGDRDYFAEIGQMIVETVSDAVGDILLYANVESGVHQVELFYPFGDGKRLRYFVSKDLGNFVYEFWEAWQDMPGEKEWRFMYYLVKNRSEIDVKFVYPEEKPKDYHGIKWRNVVIEQYFGHNDVDYSRSRAPGIE